MKILNLLLAAIQLGLPSFSLAGTGENLPIVGFDKNRQETAVAVSMGKYAQLFRKVITDVNDSALPVLRKQKARPGWMLRNVAVGIGIGATAGLGPIYSITAKPRMLLIFSNSTSPQHP